MGIGVVITKNGSVVKEISEYLGNGTNNIAEYTAVIRALQETEKLGEKEAIIRSDSQLIIRQLNGAYKIRQAHLKKLSQVVGGFRTKIKVVFEHVPREENEAADMLSKHAIMNHEKNKEGRHADYHKP